MTKTLSLRNALLFAGLLGLAACAKEDFSQTMPDDTTQEKTFDATQKAENEIATETMVETSAISTNERQNILRNYDHIDPAREIQNKALEDAIIYFHQNKSKIRNQKYVSVLDFTKRSTKKRFHIIDMESGKVWSIHVAHGKGSDSDRDGFAERFSNKPGSQASSLGYYLTGSTYNGGNGLSLKLDGLSSTNSNVRGRSVVIHGAKYVSENDVIQGRSWGCPAVAMELRTKVINMLKGGSLIYAIGN